MSNNNARLFTLFALFISYAEHHGWDQTINSTSTISACWKWYNSDMGTLILDILTKDGMKVENYGFIPVGFFAFPLFFVIMAFTLDRFLQVFFSLNYRTYVTVNKLMRVIRLHHQALILLDAILQLHHVVIWELSEQAIQLLHFVLSRGWERDETKGLKSMSKVVARIARIAVQFLHFIILHRISILSIGINSCN